jgi:rhodanese-related sulfurtransferase
MELISREELREKLRRGDELTLVMALPAHAFEAKHIPGSLNVDKPEELESLDPADEIVVYCAGVHCPESMWAYHFLVGRGYPHVRRFAGGIEDWENAGYPLETGATNRSRARRPRLVPVPESRVARRPCIPFRPVIV